MKKDIPSLSSSLKHVAIIMDGNGRWAKRKGLPAIAGHREGAKVAEQIVERAQKLGVSYLTMYAFSSENWFRDKQWVDDFIGLLRFYLKNDLKKLIEKNVQVRIIGNRSYFDADIQALLNKVEEKTKTNTGITVILALSYGGKDEIVRSIQLIASQVERGILTSGEITSDVITRGLDTQGIPDPDLLIRTSGEQRLSNFLLWQLAYTELMFIPALWPDYTADTFESNVNEFQRRCRRYGLCSP